MLINKKGTILITSLWILSILSILAAGIGFRVSIEARLSKYSMDRVKALYLAKAGFYKSQAFLFKYPNKNSDSIRDCGIVMPYDKKNEEFFVENMGDGSFAVSYDEEGKDYYGPSDEERKININTAPQAVLEGLLVDEEAAVSVITWRGTVQVLNGAWDDYYRSLDPPYKCKHEAFSVIEELMLVKGVTPELFESIKDYVTVYGDGKINLNTATQKVMLAMGLGSPCIEEMINFRNGIDKIAGTKDDGVFVSIPSQGDFQHLTANDIAILGESFKTASNFFRIESKGMVDKSKINVKIACIIDKGAKKLVYYREY